mgnify:CR=1 FL=1
MTVEITGIDYLTGEDEIRLSNLRFIVKNGDPSDDSNIFVDASEDFANFAANFCEKFGILEDADPPVVVSPESLETIRSAFERTDGQFSNVSGQKSLNSWN